MLLTRHNTFFNNFGDIATINRLFSEPGTARPWTPAVDIFETEEGIVVKADLPDVNEKEIEISLENGTLSLKGERKFVKDETGKGGYHRIERSYGSFARHFTLPETVEADKVQAQYKNGTLTITLPKKETAKPRSIKVAVQ
jgi:HSP20 family protein